MLKVKEFLTASGLATPHDRIKMVRHVDHDSRTLAEMIVAGEFDFYQSEQKAQKAPFDDCEVIVAFLAAEGNKCAFHGVYRVGKRRPFTAADLKRAPDFLRASLEDLSNRVWYDLKLMPEFDELRGRLRVTWRGPLAWVQKKDVEIHEILPPGRVRHFPGYQEVRLSWKELQEIRLNEEAHPDWKTALKFTAAIYRITDLSTGLIYIGSAYGKEGLWKRWGDYAKTGNGGNEKLKRLDHTKFQWSIVRTLSGVMSAEEVIRIEHVEMLKHGSRSAVGLNS
jgi:hypothetical protein